MDKENRTTTKLFAENGAIFALARLHDNQNMRTNINFIRQIVFLLFILAGMLSCLLVRGDEFKVNSFSKAENDLSARRFEEKDDNGDPCALIKVRTDIQGLNFQAAKGIVKIISKEGDYWVYISFGEKRLKIFKNGYKTLAYPISNSIKSYDVYVMELSSNAKAWVPSGKGNLSIRTHPPGVSVSIDGFPDLNKTTPCSFDNYKATPYRFFLTKKRYEPKDTIINIEKDLDKNVIVKLEPKFGSLVVHSNVNGVKYYLDKELVGVDSLGLFGEIDGIDIGKYSLEIKKEKYHSKTQIIEISPNDTTDIFVELDAITGSVDIRTNPPGANVYIDETFKGTTPYSESELIIGEHIIRIEKDKFLKETKTVSVKENENHRVEFSLRSYKKVRIESDPKNARLTVNGNYIGKTPEELKLPVGENSILLEKDDHEDLQKTIVISEKQNRYSFSLDLLKFQLNITSNPPGADVFVNKLKVGNTPTNSRHENGRHRIKISKEGFYPKRKKVKIDDASKDFHLEIKSMIKAYLNVLYMPKTTEYTLPMYGFEIGWSYKHASRLATSFNVMLNTGPESWETSVPTDIIVYEDTDFPTIDPKDLTFKEVYDRNKFGASIKIGKIFTRPFVFIITVGVGYFSSERFDLYEAQEDYESEDGWEEIMAGDVILNKNAQYTDDSFSPSIGLSLCLGRFVVTGNYWHLTESGPNYTFGIGYAIRD